MTTTKTPIDGCFLLTPTVFSDSRGEFYEAFHRKRLADLLGYSPDFVQDNHSVSEKGVLRGLHFQRGEFAQAKLVRVAYGEVLDVMVDLRKDSLTYLKTYKIRLDAKDHKMLYIPRGCAHGFLALSSPTVFIYKCDNYYNKESEAGIFYNDPDLGINWEYPTDKIQLSEKDKQLPLLKDLEL